jgi:hypothetical protein
MVRIPETQRYQIVYEGGLIEKVVVDGQLSTYGMAEAFADSLERILRDIDPEIRLDSIHELA